MTNMYVKYKNVKGGFSWVILCNGRSIESETVFYTMEQVKADAKHTMENVNRQFQTRKLETERAGYGI